MLAKLMDKNKKGQAAIEFIVLIGFVMLILTIIIANFQQSANEIQDKKDWTKAQEMFNIIETEIILAESAYENYNREFTIPSTLSGMPVNVSCGGSGTGNDIIIDYDNKKYTFFLRNETEGCADNIQPGKIQIEKQCTDTQSAVLKRCHIKVKSVEAASFSPLETCHDGIQNQNETEIDCGGPNCPACPECGNNIVEGDEECDGGVESATCTTVLGSDFTGNVTCTPPPNGCTYDTNECINIGATTQDCGNGIVEGTETCDDGQTPPVSGDGCNATCQTESGWTCDNTVTPSNCTQNTETCFDGKQNQDETGIDCGGVCDACETCFDNIQNQGETGIDCGGPCVATCGSTSLSLADLRDKTIEFYTGANGNPSDSYMSTSLGSVNWRAKDARDTMNSDGSWPDIDYTSTVAGGNPLENHFKRIKNLAMGYATPSQSSYRSSSVKSALEKSLLYLDQIQSLKDCKSPYTSECGWSGFLFRITLPREVSKALLLTKNDISSQSYNVGMQQIKDHWSDLSPTSRTNYNFYTAMIYLNVGLTEMDESRVMDVKTTMNNIMKTNDYLDNATTTYYYAVGLKPDSTYLDHGPLLYIAGYGEDYGSYMATYNYLTAGSKYGVDSTQLDNIVDFYADGVAWTLNDKYYDPGVMGRTSTRGLEVKENTDGLVLMANTPSSKNSIITSAAKELVNSNPGKKYDVSIAGLITPLNARSESPKYPSGHKNYPFADFTIHRRNNYYMSIKMLSDRTFTSERVGNENIKGALLMDGRMHLTLGGDEYGANDVLPTLDWARLPGITVQKQYQVEYLRGQPSGNQYGLSSGFGWPGKKQIVGGTTDGQNGVSAMDYQGLDDYKGTFTPELSWKKSWFFFDDYVVFITTNIKDDSGNTVETIIDQRPLPSSTTPMYYNNNAMSTSIPYSTTISNVEWFQSNDIGYYFPIKETIKVKRERQSGAWHDINDPYGDTTIHRNDMLTLWFDHGANVVNDEAIYVVVPDITKNEMSSWVSNNDVNILRHDSAASAVEDGSKGMFGAVFWQGTTINNIPNNIFTSLTTSAPAVVYIKKTGNEIDVSVSDPTHSSGSFSLTFNKALTKVSADSGVSVSTGGSQTTVTIQRGNPYGGATKSFSLRS